MRKQAECEKSVFTIDGQDYSEIIGLKDEPKRLEESNFNSIEFAKRVLALVESVSNPSDEVKKLVGEIEKYVKR